MFPYFIDLAEHKYHDLYLSQKGCGGAKFFQLPISTKVNLLANWWCSNLFETLKLFNIPATRGTIR
tara:strand:+ start:410 stop:607 length:198 start_codon:yes stop_codon:yes gene_type:complete